MKIGEGGAEKAQWELKTGIREIKWKGFRLFDMEVKNIHERSILNSQHNVPYFSHCDLGIPAASRAEAERVLWIITFPSRTT